MFTLNSNNLKKIDCTIESVNVDVDGTYSQQAKIPAFLQVHS
jgi:hypothetical protein